MSAPGDSIDLHLGARGTPRIRSRNLFLVDIALLSAAWLIGMVLVNPTGDFPLNDDWAYGRIVRSLLESGEYRPLDWALAPLATNVAWGSAFCLPVGFTFTALRMSTLAAGLFGTIGMYVLSRDLAGSRTVSLLAAATLAANPVYYALSYTFMTDVLFASLILWSMIFFARYLMTPSYSYWLAGTCFAAAATLSRQLGLCIPLAFAATAVLQRRSGGQSLLSKVTPLLVSVASFLALKEWLSLSGRTSSVVDAKTLDLLQQLRHIGSLTTLTLSNFFLISMYCGLFLLPLHLATASPLRRELYGRRTAVLIALLGSLSAGGICYLHGHAYSGLTDLRMPLAGNILASLGIGPVALYDISVLHLGNIDPLPESFWFAVTLGAVAGAVLMISAWGRALKPYITDRARLTHGPNVDTRAGFISLCAFLYLLPLLALNVIFDRYFIPLIPTLTAVAICNSSQLGPACPAAKRDALFLTVAGVICAASAAFAVAATHDYMAWNRTRWIALQELMSSSHVGPESIDGGFEFNGFYLYDPKVDLAPAFLDTRRSWWWVRDDTYLVSFGPVPGYTTWREYEYPKWLPHGVGKIFILKRTRVLTGNGTTSGRVVTTAASSKHSARTTASEALVPRTQFAHPAQEAQDLGAPSSPLTTLYLTAYSYRRCLLKLFHGRETRCNTPR